MSPPPFDPLAYPLGFLQPVRLADSQWIEHVPFGMALIEMLRPRTVVELGAYAGVSFCCFCQALARLGLDARAWAVDTWEGDAHSGWMAAQVYEELRGHVAPRYGAFAELVRGTFDAARERFADGSVDLLHIDGYHTYEAVRHDYETWLPKMSDRGVVLFHDIAVRQKDFGVWRLWREVRRTQRTQAFWHGHGLGLALVGRHGPGPLEALLDASKERFTAIRRFYAALGRGLRHRHERNQALAKCQRKRSVRRKLERVGGLVRQWLGMATEPSRS